jgi:ferric-dicitrate binding protein FerR (iron transport regulator)
MRAWKNKKLAHVQNSSAFSVFAVYVRHLDKRKFHWTVWLLAQVLALGLLGSGARAQNTVGTVTALSGTAHVERGGATQPVTNGMQVELKDKFTTDPGAHVTITLNDNTQLDLADQSTLVIDEQVVSGGGQTTRVSLLGGHLENLVSKAMHGTTPSFEVKTPNAIAGVRGTKFSVTFAPSSPVCGDAPTSDVAVADGSVEVANRATPGLGIEVEGGYETVVCAGKPPLPPGPLGIAGGGGTGTAAGGFAGSSPAGGGAPPPACPVCPPPGC